MRVPRTAKQAVRMAKVVQGTFPLPDYFVEVQLTKRAALRLLDQYPDEIAVLYYQSDRYCRLQPRSVDDGPLITGGE